MKLNGLVDVAISEAIKSEYKIKVGAVIFNKKRILSIGYNQIRSAKKLHPMFQEWPGSVHAERCYIKS